MSSDLRDRLQATLGSAYTLERELGGGGMSRVFVAEETSLGRKVVVKVLPPELAATVNVDRFRREIQLAAQLQHPHIVPLLAAGISDGLPYYTMPFVTGESLGARLSRAGELPVPDALKILRDVLSALSYAHDQGVVHRDIKPDNVLLSKHSAVVTDFGVAKALTAAAAPHSSLTSIGMAIGTPAYMAPEQAAADPATDHRADIYSVGAMAYEMLTGYKVFGDRSPQQMMAAHAIETPDRIEKRRPSVPPALSSLIMSALEKHPADRPQSADDMLATLDAIGTPSSISGARQPFTGATRAEFGTATPRGFPQSDRPEQQGFVGVLRNRRSARVAVVAATITIVLALAVVLANRGRSTRPLDNNLVVVVPFRVAGAEQSLSYLREGMLDLLAAKLTGEGGPRAADPRSVLTAWRRMAPSEGEDLPQEETVRLAANLGAGQVILGGIVGTPSRMVVNATVLQVPSGKPMRQEVTVEGPADSLASLVDQLAVKLLSLQAGEDQQHLAELASASLPAIRAYLEGRSAYRAGRYVDALDQFLRALQVDSTFALAAIGVIKAGSWIASPMRRVGVSRAWQFRNKLGPADRMLVLATAGPGYPLFPTDRQRIDALDSATKLGPDQPDLWFEYGDVLWHFGRSVGVSNAMARGRDAFARAYALDSSHAPAVEHLIEGAVLYRDLGQVRRLSDRYLALDSAGDHADYIRWRAAVATGDTDALTELRQRLPTIEGESLARITGTSVVDGIAVHDADAMLAEYLRKHGESLNNPLDLGLVTGVLEARGRPKDATRVFEAAVTRTGDTLALYPSRLMAMLYWDADRTRESEVVPPLRRSLARPQNSSAEQAKLHAGACAVGVWSLRRRDLQSAREMIPLLDRTLTAAQLAGAAGKEPLCLRWLREMLSINANETPSPETLRRFDRLSLQGPSDFFWPVLTLELARMYDRQGEQAKALDILRRRPYHWAAGMEYLTTYLREEGRLAAATGDRTGAAKALRHYLVVREGADPALRPQIDSVRAILATVGNR